MGLTAADFKLCREYFRMMRAEPVDPAYAQTLHIFQKLRKVMTREMEKNHLKRRDPRTRLFIGDATKEMKKVEKLCREGGDSYARYNIHSSEYNHITEQFWKYTCSNCHRDLRRLKKCWMSNRYYLHYCQTCWRREIKHVIDKKDGRPNARLVKTFWEKDEGDDWREQMEKDGHPIQQWNSWKDPPKMSAKSLRRKRKKERERKEREEAE